jgi:H+/Cl- antiporter ClcA
MYLLPVAGLFIVGFYEIMEEGSNQGTNLVLTSINEGKEMRLIMTPLIFFSTILTHMYGGSSGREGAALQIGGSIGSYLGRLFKLNTSDKRVFVMSGMAAAFSAVFGTPIAATIFAIEVVSVGNMQYSALVPCAISSLVASAVATKLGALPEAYHIAQMTDFNFVTACKTMLLGVLCAGVSVVFCIMLHKTGDEFKKRFKNPYLRIVVGGIIVVVLTLLINTREYSSTGIAVIERAIEGEAHWYAFILKMIFTAITLGCGFKGGEIVPSFFIGATFGCAMGNLIGMSPSLCAAICMVSVFCGVTNCPLSSLIIALELFGIDGIPYYLLAISISYMLSGYYGLYSTQKFVYSKYEAEKINATAKEVHRK